MLKGGSGIKHEHRSVANVVLKVKVLSVSKTPIMIPNMASGRWLVVVCRSTESAIVTRCIIKSIGDRRQTKKECNKSVNVIIIQRTLTSRAYALWTRWRQCIIVRCRSTRCYNYPIVHRLIGVAIAIGVALSWVKYFLFHGKHCF